MAERTTARDRLHRLLGLLPIAARQGGASLAALARQLDVEPRELLRDIDEATTRAFHHPAGAVEPFSILIETGEAQDATIEVHTTGEFRRPTRLSPREALAVALGLRAMAATAFPDRRSDMLGLAHRIEDELAAPDARMPPEAGARPDRRRPPARTDPAGAQPDPGDPGETDSAPGSAVGSAAPSTDDGAIEALLMDATARHYRCHITYIKPGAAPASRQIEPYRLVYALGAWYLLAHDVARDGVRLFRVDRIAAAEADVLASFDVPADFDPANYLAEDGLAFVATESVLAIVRYESPAARWVAEAAGLTLDPDGGVRVARDVADPEWLVRHVLAFGGAAVVLEPETLRSEVARVARTLAALPRIGGAESTLFGVGVERARTELPPRPDPGAA